MVNENYFQFDCKRFFKNRKSFFEILLFRPCTYVWYSIAGIRQWSIVRIQATLEYVWLPKYYWPWNPAISGHSRRMLAGQILFSFGRIRPDLAKMAGIWLDPTTDSAESSQNGLDPAESDWIRMSSAGIQLHFHLS